MFRRLKDSAPILLGLFLVLGLVGVASFGMIYEPKKSYVKKTPSPISHAPAVPRVKFDNCNPCKDTITVKPGKTATIWTSKKKINPNFPVSFSFRHGKEQLRFKSKFAGCGAIYSSSKVAVYLTACAFAEAQPVSIKVEASTIGKKPVKIKVEYNSNNTTGESNGRDAA